MHIHTVKLWTYVPTAFCVMHFMLEQKMNCILETLELLSMLSVYRMEMLFSINLHFQSKINESLIFATVHSLMNDTNLIDSCQATCNLPVQLASNIEFIRQM